MTQTCLSCHKLFQHLLRKKLRSLQCHRRGLHVTAIKLHPRIRPNNYNTVSYETQRQLPHTLAPHAQASREEIVLPTKPNRVNHHPTSLYSDTLGPSIAQSEAATQFFLKNPPQVSWVGKEWRKNPYNTNNDPNTSSGPNSTTMLTPEIIFLGRSNSGKSSLINALTNTPNLCHVGAKPGKTTTMRAYTISSSDSNRAPRSSLNFKNQNTDKFVLLDMPGYGHGSHDVMGVDILKFLGSRKQVRRAMLLLNPAHGIKQGDERVLDLLRRFRVPYQIVACKIDKVKKSEVQSLLVRLRERVQQGETKDSAAGLCLDDVLGVGGLDSKKMLGIDDIRWAILQATGLDQVAMEEQEAASMRKQGKTKKNLASQQEKVSTKAQDRNVKLATSA